jgi:choline kinase
MGRRLMPLTATRPKCLLEIDGWPLLRQLLYGLRSLGVDEWVIVVGYRRDLIQAEVPAYKLSPRSLEWVVNPEYRSTNTLASVAMAAHKLRGEPFLLLNGDLWIQPHALDPLIRRPHQTAMLVDRSVRLDPEAMKVILDSRGRVCRLGKKLPIAASSGESIGAYRFDANGGARFLDAVVTRATAGDVQAFYEAALDDLAAHGVRPAAVDVPPGTWAEIDDAHDLARAKALSPEPFRATGS